MSISPKFNCKNKNGRLVITNFESLQSYLSTLPEDVELIVRAKSNDKPRSSNQNRYFWGVVLRLLSEHTGYTTNECHELVKHLFLLEKVTLHTEHGDQVIDTPKSTTSLTTSEMEKFLLDIRQWASYELGLSIPEPNEVEYGD